jgi:hypothetical protein
MLYNEVIEEIRRAATANCRIQDNNPQGAIECR